MNDSGTFLVRKVAVLGAGVMGAQIAAHLANANVDVLLFDLCSKEGDRNKILQKAILNLQKLEPSPLSVKSKSSSIVAANYEDDLSLLQGCDLIIEAISERMEWKKDLYKKVSPYLSKNVLFATNTSGLGINNLADAMPPHLRRQFCGVHFFNPPRYMSLCELIPARDTDPELVNHLETFLTTTCGKGVVRAKDTPSFVANRIGVFSILLTIYHAEKFGIGFDLADALTGPSIGRSKSATFRTADVVGLDTMSHVIATMSDNLQDDPWHRLFKAPGWLGQLVEKGALGQKTGAGVFRKVGKEIQVLDPSLKDYRLSKADIASEVESLLKIKNPTEKFAAIRESTHPQGQFLWAIFRDLFHYCSFHLENICDNTRDLDFAIRWGYGWAMGPFETWQAAGWKQVAAWVKDDIANKKSFADVPLPEWVTHDMRQAVHTAEGSYSPVKNQFEPRRMLPVYTRQLYPDRILGEKPIYGTTVYENDGVRMWTQSDGVAILSFKSKMHAVGDEVLDGVIEAVKQAEKGFRGLVIWQTELPFSAGANLAQVSHLLENRQYEKAEVMVKKFQDASQALKFSLVPTVAAVQGLALGGGCEFVMHCSKVVAALETYMGLVEGGVGLFPAGGGCKEFAIRAARQGKGGNFFPFLQTYFTNIAMAQVSRSAEHAKEMGLLKESDTIIMNPFELLYVAKSEALALSEAGYRPPLKARDIPVAGKGGIATLKMLLLNMREGGFISEHDFLIGGHLATAMCGGEIENGTLVQEDWFLELERKLFVELLKTEKTQARINYMLKNGKPLRN